MRWRSQNRDGKSNSDGFTLLEVLISIFLLVIISLSIYQATTETYKLRDVLMTEGDFHNGVRLAMGVLDRDISLLYTPLIMLPEEKAALAQPADAQDLDAIISTDRSSVYWSPAVNKTGVRPSHFAGTDSKLTFVSVSHIRIYKERPESEFTQVSFYLDSDPFDRAAEGKVLFKTSDPNAFDEGGKVEQFKRTLPLLHGVKKWKYEYYSKERDRWDSSWDSESADNKNVYPDMIRVTLEVVGPSRLVFEGKYYFRPEIPLHGIDPST